MSYYYPDDIQPWQVCYMEGCSFRDGGVCVNCGQRLRCYYCKCFIRVDGIDAHMEKYHPMPCDEQCEGCELCYP